MPQTPSKPPFTVEKFTNYPAGRYLEGPELRQRNRDADNASFTVKRVDPDDVNLPLEPGQKVDPRLAAIRKVVK